MLVNEHAKITVLVRNLHIVVFSERTFRSGVPFLVGGRCRCVSGLDACTRDTKSIAELDVFMLVSDRAANELSEMEGTNSPLEKFGIPQWSHNQLKSGFCRAI